MTPERYERIGALFSAAKRLPPEERSVFLAQACGPDEPLRHEIESLLDYDGQTDNFIDVPALQLSAEALSSQSAPALSGSQVDHYEMSAAPRPGSGSSVGTFEFIRSVMGVVASRRQDC